jgi:hydrogenase nickel incorporation protein HypB
MRETRFMTQVQLNSNILGANDLLARKNKKLFNEHNLLVINLMSSPGSGKTTILERTIENLSGRLIIGVIEGDLYTDQDAQRIENKGAQVVQINTKGACHLDASMVANTFESFNINNIDLMVIENVGNLVCPAEFDLGEDFKTVVISITEGNDKPLKYPLIFREARVILVNKIDLLPYTDFSLDKFEKDIAQINPMAKVFLLSGRTGQGIEDWINWLIKEVRAKKQNS